MLLRWRVDEAEIRTHDEDVEQRWRWRWWWPMRLMTSRTAHCTVIGRGESRDHTHPEVLSPTSSLSSGQRDVNDAASYYQITSHQSRRNRRPLHHFAPPGTRTGMMQIMQIAWQLKRSATVKLSQRCQWQSLTTTKNMQTGRCRTKTKVLNLSADSSYPLKMGIKRKT